MEINFCDRCDAAIPEADLDTGIAKNDDGVMTCALCLEKSRTRPNLWHFLVPLGMLASAFLGAVGAVLVLGPRVSSLERSMGKVEVDVESALAPDEALTDAIRSHRIGYRAQGEKIAALSTSTAESLESVATALRDAAASNEEIAEEVVAIKEHLRQLAEAAPEEPTEDDALEALLALTGDADPGKRLSALVGLKEEKDPRVVAKAIEALADPDAHVRAQAASMLGHRNSRAAIPKLIPALEDTQAIVRAAANRALKAISGKNFDFDPVDEEEARAKAVQAWREWWVVEGGQ